VRARKPQRALFTAAALLVPAIARAHLVNSGLGPFYDGASHLALTPEDLLPALALALLAGQRGAATGRASLFALPAAWLLGGVVGLTWPTTSSGGWPSALSLLALGALVAAEARLRGPFVVALCVGFGLFHGYLNGSVMAHARLGALGLAGIVATLFVAVTLGAALVLSVRVAWGRIAVRVAGSWIAAIALLALGWSLRGR
jgi:urease accessory protein